MSLCCEFVVELSLVGCLQKMQDAFGELKIAVQNEYAVEVFMLCSSHLLTSVDVGRTRIVANCDSEHDIDQIKRVFKVM